MSAQEITALLRKFIAFRTIAGEQEQKRACHAWIAETFFPGKGSRILTGEVDGNPYLALIHPDPRILFFAHTDVVPAEEEQFTMRVDGEIFIGRGVNDMKGNTLPFLLAYRNALAEGRDPPMSILLTSDEETAGPTIPQLLREGRLGTVPLAFTPDTQDSLVCEHKGIIWADLACRGRSAHAALPWNGENPIPALCKALETLREAFPMGDESGWNVTVTPTELRASATRNRIPEEAWCGVDIRFPPGDSLSPEKLLNQIAAMLPPHCSIRPTLTASPLATDPGHPTLSLFRSITSSVRGQEVALRREHGGTDARYFGARGIPAFLYGARGGGMHGADEWVALPSLLELRKIAEKFLTELDIP